MLKIASACLSPPLGRRFFAASATGRASPEQVRARLLELGWASEAELGAVLQDEEASAACAAVRDLSAPRVLPSAVEAIGATPCVDLSRLVAATPGLGGRGAGRIVAKLENLNPGYSKKDRIARQMLEDAKARGALTPGQTVVELTSGNTGTGLAIACAVRGHRFVAVMSAGNSHERAHMMRALGAEVVLVPQLPGSVPGQVSGADLDLVEEEACRVVDQRGAFRADQFALAGNFRAHFLRTGPELVAQAGGSGVRLDGFVDFVGSGGTFAGVAAYLRAQRGWGDGVRCFAVEPTAAPVLAAEAGVCAAVDGDGAHQVQGGGYSKGLAELPMLGELHSLELVDGHLTVHDVDAVEATRRLAREEGIFGGFSAGANVAAALQVLQTEWGHGKTIGVVVCDSGLKYLSTNLWEKADSD